MFCIISLETSSDSRLIQIYPMERSHYDIMSHLVRLDHSLDKLFIYPKHSLGVERLIAWFLFTVHQSQELYHNPWKDHSQLHALRTRDKTHKAKKNAEMQVEVRLVNRISTNADHLSTEHSQDSMPLSYLIIVLANRRKVLLLTQQSTFSIYHPIYTISTLRPH